MFMMRGRDNAVMRGGDNVVKRGGDNNCDVTRG